MCRMLFRYLSYEVFRLGDRTRLNFNGDYATRRSDVNHKRNPREIRERKRRTRGVTSIGRGLVNFRVVQRGARGIAAYGIDIESQASRQASRLAASRAGGGARRGKRFGSGDACRRGGGGRRTVDPGRRGGKKVRARPSERARGSGTARRDATHRAAPRRAATSSWQHGASAVRSFVRSCARRGNAAARPSRTPADPTDTHGRTENGGPEKERIPFCRAGGDEKRRGANERAGERERRTNDWQRRGRRGKGREDKRAERERVVEMKRERESDPPRS